MVIWMLLTWSRFHSGSNIELAKRVVDDVLHRLLAEVVVDAEDVLLGKEFAPAGGSASRAVARSWPNGFSTTSRALFGAAGLRQPFRDGGEQAWRHGEVVQRPLRLTQLLCAAAANVDGSL